MALKILLISEAGYSCDLAARMVAEGHDIKVWIKEKDWKQLYDGLLPKVPTWQSAVQWADLVVFDHSGMSDIWKQIKNIKPCFGGGEWADKLEKDRTYAHQLFKQIGFKAFESVRCKTIEEAQKHVLSHKVKHVVKPVGKDVDSWHIIIGEEEDGSDANALLESYKDHGLTVDYIEIEERKEGIEVGLSGWFAGSDWCGDINVNFEHKRFATGFPEGIGPLTGETGTAMRYDSQENKFFKKTLDRMKPILTKEDYRGQIDVSFIADVKTGDLFPLEATPRLGYPACMIESAIQVTDWAELFYKIATAEPFENKTLPDWAIGVVVMTPGYPSIEEAKKRSSGLPVFGVTPENIADVHLVEVKAGKSLKGDIDIVTAPGMGYPFVVTGVGSTLDEAKRKAYTLLSKTNKKRVYVPNGYNRTDIGDRVKRQEQDIYRLGLLTDKKYQPELEAVL